MKIPIFFAIVQALILSIATGQEDQESCMKHGTCTANENYNENYNEDPCEDLHESCPHWAGDGECMLNPKYMKSACRLSCSFCVNIQDEKSRGVQPEELQNKIAYFKMDTGVDQHYLSTVTDDQEEREQIKYVIRDMDEYVRNTVIQKEMDGVRNLCKNEDSRCAYWVFLGKCSKDLMFMMKNCPLACRTCEYLDKFTRCTTDDNGHLEKMTTFPPGSINQMFEQIQAGSVDRLKPFRPEFVSMPDQNMQSNGPAASEEDPPKPWILLLNDFLSDEETDRLIDLGHEIGWAERRDSPANKREVRHVHSSKMALCDQNSSCEQDAIFQKVMEKIQVLTETPKSHFEFVELVRYQFGESRGTHHDFRTHDAWKPAGPRVFTIFLCLSDVEEGGAMGFPDLDWEFVKLRKGQALLWANVLDDSNSDLPPTEKHPKMFHERLPVQKGELFGANVWVHLSDWRSEFDRGCH